MRLLLIPLLLCLSPARANWGEWWTYEGISGPSYWGVINPAWTLCSKGRVQSPVNIRPRALVYDPTLGPVRVDKGAAVSGVLGNTGQSLVFKVDRSMGASVNITGGPLSYRYQFEELFLHWGHASGHASSSHASSAGSEHSVDHRFFPAEIQLFGFNANLFKNLSEAILDPHGAVAVAIMVQETDRDREANEALEKIAEQFDKVVYRNQNYPVSDLQLSDLLPSTEDYMTYEGSTTYPGCWESVTWVIMNKPIYMTRRALERLRTLMQGDTLSPKAPLAGNARPLQELNGRSVRTNIQFDNARSDHLFGKKRKEDSECPDVVRDTFYKANTWGDSATPRKGGGI